MAVRVLYNNILPQSCGVGEIGIFRLPMTWGDLEGPFTHHVRPMGGCGWVIASFTDQRPEYKQAYEELCQRWKLVYQSPVRTNRRTNHPFFFCIFDIRG